MRVLIISRCPPYPLYLGDRLILYHLARELAARGYTLDLIALNDRPDIPDERAQYAAFFQSITVIPESRRSWVRLLGRAFITSHRFPASAENAWSPALWQQVQAQITSNHYNVVHVFGGISVYELAHALPLPRLITPYESYSLLLKRELETGDHHLLRRLSISVRLALTRRFEQFIFTPYARTVVVSETDRAELLRLNPSLQVEVIPNGVDLSAFPPAIAPRDPNMLLFTGNFEYSPNVDAAWTLVREVLPQVRAVVPDATLYLVGNAPPPELQALTGEGIIVTGRVPDIREYLAKAAIFVSPLRYGAGIKNKVLEALAMGCAVVGTPMSFDGIAVTHEHDALIANVDELAAATIRLLNDAPLRERLGANGRALIESRYTWANVAKAYEQLYAEVARE